MFQYFRNYARLKSAILQHLLSIGNVKSDTDALGFPWRTPDLIGFLNAETELNNRKADEAKTQNNPLDILDSPTDEPGIPLRKHYRWDILCTLGWDMVYRNAANWIFCGPGRPEVRVKIHKEASSVFEAVEVATKRILRGDYDKTDLLPPHFNCRCTAIQIDPAALDRAAKSSKVVSPMDDHYRHIANSYDFHSVGSSSEKYVFNTKGCTHGSIEVLKIIQGWPVDFQLACKIAVCRRAGWHFERANVGSTTFVNHRRANEHGPMRYVASGSIVRGWSALYGFQTTGEPVQEPPLFNTKHDTVEVKVAVEPIKVQINHAEPLTVEEAQAVTEIFAASIQRELLGQAGYQFIRFTDEQPEFERGIQAVFRSRDEKHQFVVDAPDQKLTSDVYKAALGKVVARNRRNKAKRQFAELGLTQLKHVTRGTEIGGWPEGSVIAADHWSMLDKNGTLCYVPAIDKESGYVTVIEYLRGLGKDGLKRWGLSYPLAISEEGGPQTAPTPAAPAQEPSGSEIEKKDGDPIARAQDKPAPTVDQYAGIFSEVFAHCSLRYDGLVNPNRLADGFKVDLYGSGVEFLIQPGNFLESMATFDGAREFAKVVRAWFERQDESHYQPFGSWRLVKALVRPWAGGMCNFQFEHPTDEQPRYYHCRFLSEAAQCLEADVKGRHIRG